MSTIREPDCVLALVGAEILSGRGVLEAVLVLATAPLEALEVPQYVCAKAATAALSATSHAVSLASIRDWISRGLEQMHWASVAWQPEAWMAARSAGSAHAGTPRGRPLTLSAGVAVVGPELCWGADDAKGRAKARRTLVGKRGSCIENVPLGKIPFRVVACLGDGKVL